MSTQQVAEPRQAWIRAVESRDPRFDGWVTVGVTSTGIYCRPSCPTPVRPKPKNMTFFSTPAAAQQAGFRACKRCAPDATPGSPEWNRRDDLVARAVRAIDDGEIDRTGVPGLSEKLAVSSRHLNRLMNSELGVGPLALARARRARAARVLLETTALPITDVAFAAGFDSVRQFNDTVRETFARTPTEVRKLGSGPTTSSKANDIRVRLPHRLPVDTSALLRWLRLHHIVGAEEVSEDRYVRSLRLPGGQGVVQVEFGKELFASFRLESLADLPFALHRVRRLLDLDADPEVINAALGTDPALAPMISKRPGLRSPGEVSGTDAAIRAVLHQQVSLASARGICARLLAQHGEPLEPGMTSNLADTENTENTGMVVTTVFPSAEKWASLDPEVLGMPKSRARALVALADAIASGSVDLSPSASRAEAVAQLQAVKGIGPWTANVIAAKALCDPDAFAAGDLALLREASRLGLPNVEKGLGEHAEAWKPWRSYAMQHLWNTYLDRQEQ